MHPGAGISGATGCAVGAARPPGRCCLVRTRGWGCSKCSFPQPAGPTEKPVQGPERGAGPSSRAWTHTPDSTALTAELISNSAVYCLTAPQLSGFSDNFRGKISWHKHDCQTFNTRQCPGKKLILTVPLLWLGGASPQSSNRAGRSTSFPAPHECAWESRRWSKYLRPCHPVGDPERVPGLWLRPGPAMAVGALWTMDQWVQPLCLLNKQNTFGLALRCSS